MPVRHTCGSASSAACRVGSSPRPAAIASANRAGSFFGARPSVADARRSRRPPAGRPRARHALDAPRAFSRVSVHSRGVVASRPRSRGSGSGAAASSRRPPRRSRRRCSAPDPSRDRRPLRHAPRAETLQIGHLAPPFDGVAASSAVAGSRTGVSRARSRARPRPQAVTEALERPDQRLDLVERVLAQLRPSRARTRG